MNCPKQAKPTILLISHGWGGGVDQHIKELVTHFGQRARFLIACPKTQSAPDNQPPIIRMTEGSKDPIELGWEKWLEKIRKINVSRIHFHHTTGWPDTIYSLVNDLEIPYDVTAHDFFFYCPRMFLSRGDGRYCGEPDENSCASCVADLPIMNGAGIRKWRQRSESFLNGADRIFCPSIDALRRLKTRFPKAPFYHLPHLDNRDCFSPVKVPLRETSDPLKVVCLGSLDRKKGADFLEEVARLALLKGAQIEFTLIGFGYRPLLEHPRAKLRVLGPYENSEASELLQLSKADLVWFPAQSPETYSYTLSAALAAGLPIIATDLGAFPERLRGRKASWILPWDTTPAKVLDFFQRYRLQWTQDSPIQQPNFNVTERDKEPAQCSWSSYLQNPS